MTSLVIYIATFGVRMYKNRFINAMETLTYFNIIALSIFTWYTIDADTNQTAITNISVGITFTQLIAVIVYHAYKHMNQKLFTMIQGSAICIQMEEMIARKQKERINHKLAPSNENILLDMIDRPTNTDYNIPQAQSLNPFEPTQSFLELPESQQQPATPPPSLEATNKESELESEQQANEEDRAYVNENPSTKTNISEQCINNDMVQSSQEVSSFPVDSGQQEEGDGSQCIAIKGDIH